MPVAKKSSSIISDEVYVNTTSSSVSNGVLVFVLLLVLSVNCLVLYFVMGYTLSLTDKEDGDIGIKRVLLDLEYSKVGGKKNYDTLQKYSQMQIKGQMGQIEQYVNGGGTQNPSNSPAQVEQPMTNLTPEDIGKIRQDAAIEGNKDASILVIEYSDMECPFCIKQFHETKLWPSLKAQYGDKVSFAFKQNRWVNHKGTEIKALGSLCAWKIGGDAGYIKFYTAVMDGSTNEGGVYDQTKLDVLAKNAGLDVAKWKSCVDAKETLAQFEAQSAEAQKFNLRWTPGTLILNVKTGKYSTVEWAYPFTAFTAKIDELLK